MKSRKRQGGEHVVTVLKNRDGSGYRASCHQCSWRATDRLERAVKQRAKVEHPKQEVAFDDIWRNWKSWHRPTA